MRLTEFFSSENDKPCEKKYLFFYTCSLLSAWNEDVMAGVVEVIL